MQNLQDINGYRSAKAYAYIVVAAFIAAAIVASLIAFGSLLALTFPNAGLETGEGEFMSAGLIIAGITSLFDMPVRIGLIVFFLIWIYKAYKNLTPLRAYHQEFTPGWAVGWWFVPFMNIIRPYQVVREIYNESDPEYESDMGFLSSTGQGAPAFISLWWMAFLFGGFAYRFSDVLYGKGDLPATEAVFIALFFGGFLWTIAAGLGAYIVFSIARRQDARFLRIINTVDPTPQS